VLSNIEKFERLKFGFNKILIGDRKSLSTNKRIVLIILFIHGEKHLKTNNICLKISIDVFRGQFLTFSFSKNRTFFLLSKTFSQMNANKNMVF